MLRIRSRGIFNAVRFLSASVLFICASVRAAGTFQNTNFVLINNDAPADPYPSQIAVSNLVGEATKVTLTLSNLTHDYPTDLEILVVNPSGQNCLVFSHSGGFQPVTNLTVTFDDDAPSFAAHAPQVMVAGVFRPTVSERPGANYLLVPPAPQAPYDYDLSALSGTDPNGAWKLFIIDADDENGGVLANGWSLNIETQLRLKIRAVADELEISWPSNAAATHVLRTSEQIQSTGWAEVQQSPTLSQGRMTVRIPKQSAPHYFRLEKRP